MRCSECQRVVPTKAFATFRTRKGEIRRRGICKECRGKYAKQNFERLKRWRKNYNVKNRTKKAIQSFERRMAIRVVLDKIKSQTPCADCHKKFPPVAMDFDHCRGKNRSISSMAAAGYKIELIFEEIKLCELVCACCHRVRTAIRKQNHAPTHAKSQLLFNSGSLK